jgi:hypothetical protein
MVVLSKRALQDKNGQPSLWFCTLEMAPAFSTTSQMPSIHRPLIISGKREQPPTMKTCTACGIAGRESSGPESSGEPLLGVHEPNLLTPPVTVRAIPRWGCSLSGRIRHRTR